LSNLRPTFCFIKNGDVVREFQRLEHEWRTNSVELIWDFNEIARDDRAVAISETGSTKRGTTSHKGESLHLYTVFVKTSGGRLSKVVSLVSYQMQLFRLLGRYRPKYVVCSNLRFLVLTLVYCTLLRCTFIVNFARETQLTAVNLVLIRLFGIRDVIVPGRHMKKHLQAKRIKSRIYIRLPNYPRAFFEDTDLPDFPDHAFTAIFVARLERAKGVYEAYAAATRLLARYPDMGFVFLGNGRELHNLRDRARADGWNDRIHFLGYRDSALVGSYLRRSDVLLFPSYTEGFAKTWYEATLTQTPIIGTGLPAIREYLSDAVEMLCVAPRDAEALEAAIVRFRSDDGLRLRMRENLKSAEARIRGSADGSFCDCVRQIVA
jgi:glycosyltransferase involved in cell wall biosynthesis